MLSKSIFGFLFFVSFGLFAHDNFLEAWKPAANLCKMKVDLSDLLVQEDGMYLCKNRQFIQISGLQYENGSYTAIASTDIIENIFGVWWCYNCQHWNSKYDAACFYCGKPR